ncbi:MAG: hypothetical protein ACLUE2_17975 [Bacteroides cellulosilyticus]
MNNENNVPQVNGNVPAQKDNSGKQQQTAPRRGELKAEFAHVLAFLNSCTLYQADAVRVMVSHATGNGKYEDINPDDRLAVNRFLNHGMNKTNTLTADAVMPFRVGRSEVLLNTVTQFCNQTQALKATVALMRITTDAEAVKTAFARLPDDK